MQLRRRANKYIADRLPYVRGRVNVRRYALAIVSRARQRRHFGLLGTAVKPDRELRRSSLHGVTKPASFTVKQTGDSYTPGLFSNRPISNQAHPRRVGE